MRDSDAVTPILKLKRPWDHNKNSIWLASSISLQRNIEKFIFPGKLEIERKRQIVSLVGKEILALESLSNPTLLKAEELSSFEKEYMVEHFLTRNSFHQTGLGEAFILDDTGEQLMVFNVSDHLYFYRLDTSDNLEGCWNQLVKLETALGKTFAYSFSPKFGFLTADPSKCGTGLTVLVYLQLPALVHLEKMNSLLEEIEDENVLITGMQGDPTDVIGDVLAVQNNFTLGITEENILSIIRSFVTKLIMEENSSRLAIRQSENPMIMDKVSRAFAVLLHSYQIEAVEALNAISILKLGVDMGWIEGVTIESLNHLFFNCRRSHLVSQYSEKLQQQELPHKRAEYIHRILKDVKLLM